MADVSWWELVSKVLIPIVFVQFGLIWKIKKEATDEIKESRKEAKEALDRAQSNWVRDLEANRSETQNLGKQILALQLKIVETYPTKNDLIGLEQRIIERIRMVLDTKLGGTNNK